MFRLLNVAGRAALEQDGQWFDLANVAADPSLADPMVAVARFADLHALQASLGGRTPDGTVDPTTLGPVVPRPSKVFAIGLNYRSHAGESNMEVPPAPLTFTKFPSCLVGPAADVVLRGPTTDWEIELVVVIGKGGRHIPGEQAWQHVAGLTLGQDISDRTQQFVGKPPQFSLGKSFDTFGPVGPALVSLDQFDDVDDIEIWCDVAGERMQHGHTRDLIFPVPFLIEYLSGICTLEPGDIIFSGTPEGVGMARGRFLAAGELIESGSPVIGTMVNRCVTAG